MSNHRARLEQAIRDRSALIGVVGLGYVGLPLALAFSAKGFNVLGFDTNPDKVSSLNRGEGYLHHLAQDGLRKAVESARLSATVDLRRLGEPDAVLICVPTPLTPQREPDMRFVVATAEALAEGLRPRQIVILESTTYPGTTETLLRGILEGGGLTTGRDFFLAYSPEREDPGNPRFSTATIPKVVGGVDDDSGELAQLLYDQIVVSTVRVSSARVAEATKLTENVFRAVNIALVNELKMVYDRLGIDVWEVLDAASTKPFGFMRFNPGPGWGGHCIPIDPFYLSWKARQSGLTPRFIELAGEINVQMPRHVVVKIQEALEGASKSMHGSRILLLGIAYKKDIGDPRESPAFEILSQLLDLDADVSYHDPYVARAPSMRTWRDLPPLESEELTSELLGSVDVVVVVTDHSCLDYEWILEHAPHIVDTRGVYRAPHPKVTKA